MIGTEHGVRIVMGDVRGHGLAALGTVAAVLGSFREAVHDEAELAGVLRRLERAMARHLRERAKAEHPSSGLDPDNPVAEEFVTVLLLEIGPDGEMRALNCGHPRPYLLRHHAEPVGVRGQVEHLAVGDPLPPLGLFPLPAELPVVRCGPFLPGEALFLHTDGVEDARDGVGRFFPLGAALAEASRSQPLSPQSVLRTVFTNCCATRADSRRTTWPYWSCATTVSRVGPLGGAGNRATSHDGPAADQPPLVIRCSVVRPNPAEQPSRATRRSRPPRHGVSGRQLGGRRESGRRTVRGGAGGPAGLLRGNSVNRVATLRNSARTARIRALRSHPV